ncbi:MAG TPA: PhoU domain-containing protein [Terriglobales bacterium]|nr:PhoU domain-containing protein [Terriglobales bacterium]
MALRAEPNAEQPLGPRMVELTLAACDLAQAAWKHAVAGLTSNAADQFDATDLCELELDQLDRQLDEELAAALGMAKSSEQRELLSCLKLMTDLERIGDLAATFAGRGRAVGRHLDAEDVRELAEMGQRVARMLEGVRQAYAARDLMLAVTVLRADAEVDRLRNLLFHRHIHGQESGEVRESIQVLFMTQALERAGDHAKNLAEEVCHLISGHTLRHVLRSNGKSREQMLLDWLKRQQ